MREGASSPLTAPTAASNTAPPATLTAAAWAALDACAEGVTILDPDGLIRYVNPASAAMGDSSVEESIGRNLWQEYRALVGTEFHAAITPAAGQDEPVEWNAY